VSRTVNRNSETLCQHFRSTPIIGHPGARIWAFGICIFGWSGEHLRVGKLVNAVQRACPGSRWLIVAQPQLLDQVGYLFLHVRKAVALRFERVG
jgi:hypothetical protein